MRRGDARYTLVIPVNFERDLNNGRSPQLQVALLPCFFGLFPIMFLSGTMTPIGSMPQVIQSWTQFSPLRHYMEIAMGSLLKGVGFAELWPAALKMAGIGAVLYLIAAWRFRRNLKAG